MRKNLASALAFVLTLGVLLGLSSVAQANCPQGTDHKACLPQEQQRAKPQQQQRTQQQPEKQRAQQKPEQQRAKQQQQQQKTQQQPEKLRAHRQPEQQRAHQNNNAISTARQEKRRQLKTRESTVEREKINATRSKLTGINRHPAPQGTVTTRSNGSRTVKAADGRQYGFRANGTLAHYSGKGTKAELYPNGRVRTLHTEKLRVDHVARGGRVVVQHRPDRSTVVSFGRRHGYVERHYERHGHHRVHRTHVHGSHTYSHVYVPYHYHGVSLVYYVPTFYYVPAFYGWAYYPWYTPISYRWGWAGAPWYQASYGYFAPEPFYPAPAFWLADRMLAHTLQMGYQSQQQAAAVQNYSDAASASAASAEDDAVYAQTDTPISPELKKAIAEEVTQQLAIEHAASTQPNRAQELNSLQQIMQPNHLFVVDRPINVINEDNQNCGLSPGNVIKLLETPAPNAKTAKLRVESSRKADCPAYMHITVDFEDLQEMHNSFRAQLDSGLGALREQQGKKGIPKAPSSAITPPPRPVEDMPAPEGDAQAIGELLKDAQKQADQGEADREAGAFQD